MNLRNVVYCLGIKYGKESDWNNMFYLFQKESVQVEHERLMYALSCSRDTFTLKKLLNIAVDVNNTAIRLQDKSIVFELVAQNRIGNSMVFEFFTKNWDKIYHE